VPISGSPFPFPSAWRIRRDSHLTGDQRSSVIQRERLPRLKPSDFGKWFPFSFPGNMYSW
jgi:hypothetical protein